MAVKERRKGVSVDACRASTPEPMDVWQTYSDLAIAGLRYGLPGIAQVQCYPASRSSA